MLLQRHPYPFHSLSIPDAQRIWQIAEEDCASRSLGKPGDSTEPSPLLLAVRALDRTAYRELITLACLGRGHDTSFDCNRAHAEAEISHDYLALNCPRLHCYLRHALSSFGIEPIHEPDERNYPADITDQHDG